MKRPAGFLLLPAGLCLRAAGGPAQAERASDDMEILFHEGALALAASEEKLVLRDGEREYEISSHPYEPCTFLRDHGRPAAVIHNGFGADAIRRAALTGEALRSATGNEYGAARLCRLLAFAAARGLTADIGYAEGSLAVEDLKALGALSPETAVEPRVLGLRKIDGRFSRSRKRGERVMYTEDGRAYVRIKG